MAELAGGVGRGGPKLLDCPLKVLLISDRAGTVTRIGQMLDSPGYEFDVVAAGEFTATGTPHVILLDVEGSPVEGERILTRLRGMEPTRETPVVLLTGEDGAERWLSRLEGGLVDYLGPAYSRDDLAMRITLVRRTRAVLDEARQLNRRLETMSITDPLTGLYNSWYLQHRCREEITRAKRHQHSVSCLFLDVDNFKRVNDSYGHPAGNAVLAELGGLLKSATRASDIVGRYGGEEFLLILPETNRGEAVVLGERLCRVVEMHQFSVGEEVLNVTVSAGVATFPGEGVRGHETLVGQADRACYQAKLNGRNQVGAG